MGIQSLASSVHLITGVAILTPAAIHVVRGWKHRRERERRGQAQQVVSKIRKRIA